MKYRNSHTNVIHEVPYRRLHTPLAWPKREVHHIGVLYYVAGKPYDNLRHAICATPPVLPHV